MTHLDVSVWSLVLRSSTRSIRFLLMLTVDLSKWPSWCITARHDTIAN